VIKGNLGIVTGGAPGPRGPQGAGPEGIRLSQGYSEQAPGHGRLMPLILAAAAIALSTALWAQDLEPPRASATVVPGKPQQIGAYPGHEGHPTKKWIATLRCEPVSYTLQHWACYHESYPHGAVAIEGQIGMMSPGGGNWYTNGFFNFALDDQQGRDYPVKTIRALDSGERASCEFVWELPQAWVRVRFMTIPGQQPLFCSIVQLPKTEEIATLKVRLACYPSGYFHDGARVGLTAAQVIKSTSKGELDPEKEWWMILYDEHYDLGVSGGIGGAGAITEPELVGKSTVEIGAYGCFWNLEAKSGGKELRFAFWNGLKLKNAELAPTLKPKFEPTLTTLRGIDFRPLRFREEVVAQVSSEFEKLLVETQDAEAEETTFKTTLARAEETTFKTTLARLQELRPTVMGDQPNLEAEDEYLKLLDELDNTLWQLRMKWVFSD